MKSFLEKMKGTGWVTKVSDTLKLWIWTSDLKPHHYVFEADQYRYKDGTTTGWSCPLSLLENDLYSSIVLKT